MGRAGLVELNLPGQLELLLGVLLLCQKPGSRSLGGVLLLLEAINLSLHLTGDGIEVLLMLPVQVALHFLELLVEGLLSSCVQLRLLGLKPLHGLAEVSLQALDRGAVLVLSLRQVSIKHMGLIAAIP